jgi:hypothetical protein
LDQRLCRACSSTCFTFVRAHGVERVHSTRSYGRVSADLPARHPKSPSAYHPLRCHPECCRRSTGKTVVRIASFGSCARSHVMAYLLSEHDGTTNGDCVSAFVQKQQIQAELTSNRCRTFFTNIFPSAANPLTAKTALSVLKQRNYTD